jgi:hypothetical protein
MCKDFMQATILWYNPCLEQHTVYCDKPLPQNLKQSRDEDSTAERPAPDHLNEETARQRRNSSERKERKG